MAPAPASKPTVAQLEQVAIQIVRLISDMPGLGETKLAVIGDLALCHHLPQYDRAASIDFIVSRSSSPGRVKKEIVSHPMSPLVERSGMVFFPLPSRQEVEVKLVPDWLCPYLPVAARPVRESTKALPYVSLEDLLVFKVDACGLRERESSKRREALDAAALLELAAKHTPLSLDESKMQKVEQGLDEVVEYSEPDYEKSWWQRSLGLAPDRQRSATEILSELAEPSPTTPTQPTSPMSPSKAPSIYSTMSRTSSSMSTMSQHSTTSSMSSITAQDDRSSEKNGRPRKMSATSKPPRHSRHKSNGGSASASILPGMQRLEIGRPDSPGLGMCNLG